MYLILLFLCFWDLRRALFYDATDKKGEAPGHRSFNGC